MKVFNETVAKSKVKPSASAQNFEYALLKGLVAVDGVELTVVTAESIAAYPRGNRFYLKGRREELFPSCVADVVSALNLPGIKQFCHGVGAAKQLKKWLKYNKNCEEQGVLLYGLYPAVAKRLIKVCKKAQCRVFSVITDIPDTMFTYTGKRGIIKKLFSGFYKQGAVGLQNKFDGYVFLTDAMSDKVAPGKPYVVVETIADAKVFDGIIVDKAKPPAIAYAGALYKKYGLDLLLEAFSLVKEDCELWLFGSGDYEEQIIAAAKQDERIKFYGRVSREEVLNRERAASLLLNVRNDVDDYTKYSFPSKMVEYLLSGTPVLTTRLSGIPDEYYRYCFTPTGRTASEIAKSITTVLSDPQRAADIAVAAQRFVIEKKNSCTQAKKIVDFIVDNL